MGRSRGAFLWMVHSTPESLPLFPYHPPPSGSVINSRKVGVRSFIKSQGPGTPWDQHHCLILVPTDTSETSVVPIPGLWLRFFQRNPEPWVGRRVRKKQVRGRCPGADAESPHGGLTNPSICASEPLSTLIHCAVKVLCSGLHGLLR